MRRRAVLHLLTLASVAGCGSPGSAESLPAPGPSPDLGWPVRGPEFSHGFCFTLVRGIHPWALVDRLGGEELERAEWHRVVGPGDGEVGVRTRFFVGIARVAKEWVVIVEDNGTLGITEKIVRPLSANGGEVLSYRGGAGDPERLMVFRDGDLLLDLDGAEPDRPGGSRPDDFRFELLAAGLTGRPEVIEHTGPALSFLAGRTGVALTLELLRTRTYLLVTVPQV